MNCHLSQKSGSTCLPANPCRGQSPTFWSAAHLATLALVAAIFWPTGLAAKAVFETKAASLKPVSEKPLRLAANNSFVSIFLEDNSGNHKKTSTNKKSQGGYKLGGKVPTGHLKSYGLYADQEHYDPEIKKYRAPHYNERYQYQGRRTYQTMCVRLRDGYYWPINFSQTRRGLQRDRLKCQKSCNGPVALFYKPSTSDDIANMRDEKGQLYKDLENAYLYRTEYVKEAQCKPQPWSKEATLKHADYAKKDLVKKRHLHIRQTKNLEKRRKARLRKAKHGVSTYRVSQINRVYRRQKKYR